MKRSILTVALVLAACSLISAQAFNDPNKWNGFDDKANGGSSTFTKATTMETVGGKEVVAVAVTGTVTTKYQYGFVGLAADPTPETLKFIKTSKGIRFQAVGDGQKYRVMLATSNITDYDYYNFVFTAPKGTPVTVDVPYTKLTQQGWGAKKKFDTTLITKVQFQTIGQPLPSFTFKIIGLEAY
jgi:hypothetical protein